MIRSTVNRGSHRYVRQCHVPCSLRRKTTWNVFSPSCAYSTSVYIISAKSLVYLLKYRLIALSLQWCFHLCRTGLNEYQRQRVVYPLSLKSGVFPVSYGFKYTLCRQTDQVGTGSNDAPTWAHTLGIERIGTVIVCTTTG